jgi:hypothetical protein
MIFKKTKDHPGKCSSGGSSLIGDPPLLIGQISKTNPEN